MKTRWTFLMIVLSLLALLLLGGCGPAKYAPKANEELYGTWINKSYSGHYARDDIISKRRSSIQTDTMLSVSLTTLENTL